MSSCRCDTCERERQGKRTLFRSDVFCDGCGHGYFDVGGPDSFCPRCGCLSFQRTKPPLIDSKVTS